MAALSLIVAGCGSSSKSSGHLGQGNSINVGVLTDITGLASSGNKGTVGGVAAGVALAKAEGYSIHTFVGDTTSSPSAALTAAKKLVEQDHVVAVLANSSLTFAAAAYLQKQQIPVIGLAEDGSEWQTDTNMFGIGGAIKENLVPDIYGRFFKMQGATVIGTLGYNISPASAEYAKGVADSARHAGLSVGYENANFPFGSTNVAPVALAMKSAGVNGVYAPVDPNTAFALVSALRQEGAAPKVALFATGYGADLLQAGSAAGQVAQGLYFSIGSEPVEMNTPATTQFQSYLAKTGFRGEPGISQYNGYSSVGLLLAGLKKAGSNPSAASLLAALGTVHSWDNLGLWGGRTIDPTNRADTVNADGPGNCTYVVRYSGTTFHPVAGAEPICGPIIPGLNETP
jgi:branched-chain amino acid transport system substrate-binding protein